jgi:hypothetical protein
MSLCSRGASDMGDLSNKSLALLLFASVVISLLGTFVVLNKIGTSDTYTGLATSGTGIVNLSVSSTLSITTADANLVNFGACSINETGPVIFNSFNTENTSQYCTGTTNLPNNISVRNDGNVVVNVSISSSVCGAGAMNTSNQYNASCTFLNNTNTAAASNGFFQYNISNYGRGSYTGGCGTVNGTATWSWWNITQGGFAYHACTNLATAPLANSFIANFRLRVPAGLATGVQTATITFTAS